MVSVRLEMLQVARLAPKVLGESSELVREFLCHQQNEDGGFRDRDGVSDLYYTVFGIESLVALQMPLPTERLQNFLDSFGTGAGLDFVHLCCLARARAALAGATRGTDLTGARLNGVLERVEHFRSADGGYNVRRGSPYGTAYANFLALAAYQDSGGIPPEPDRILESVGELMTPDGAWGNERGLKLGGTNATAAAVIFLRQLQFPIPPETGDWLLARHHEQGGFLATPTAPFPDLLSTATALHALAAMECDIAEIKEACLDFVDSLWTNEGAFHGHWGDDLLDCEYTYYGLLALGHLSL